VGWRGVRWAPCGGATRDLEQEGWAVGGADMRRAQGAEWGRGVGGADRRWGWRARCRIQWLPMLVVVAEDAEESRMSRTLSGSPFALAVGAGKF